MSTTATFRHVIILMLSAEVGVKSTSAPAFGLESLRTMFWAPICYLTGWPLNGSLFTGTCFTAATWSWGSGYEVEVAVSVWSSSSELWQQHPSKWIWRRRRIAWPPPSSDLTAIRVRYGGTWRGILMQSVPGPKRSWWQEFKQTRQRSTSRRVTPCRLRRNGRSRLKHVSLPWGTRVLTIW
jgi:hypothetical protein